MQAVVSSSMWTPVFDAVVDVQTPTVIGQAGSRLTLLASKGSGVA